MSDTAYCYHCQQHHPRSEMRQVMTKVGKRWRCIRSIEATKVDRATREAFGRAVTEDNKAQSASRARISNALRSLNADGTVR
jgi:hypothetical protein